MSTTQQGDRDYAAFEVIYEPDGYASYELTLELEADYACLELTFELDPELGERYELLRLPVAGSAGTFSDEDEAFFNSEINTNILLEQAEETAADRAQLAVAKFLQRARTLVSQASPTITRA